MPHHVGAIALVRRDAADPGDPAVADPALRSEWLAVWNPAKGVLMLPEAEKLEGETYRDSLVREIAWAADLDAGRDYLVSHAPRAHVQFAEECEGPDQGDVTVVEFYVCELFRRGRAKLAETDGATWLTAADIEAGESGGRPLASRQLALMKRAGLVPPREG